MRLAFIATVPTYHHVMRGCGALGVIACTLAMTVGPARAQQARTVRGMVIEMHSTTPIPYVQVWLVHDRHILDHRFVTTDKAGRFSIQFDGEDADALYARRIGYLPVMLHLENEGDSDTSAVTIKLPVSPARLAGTTVTATHAMRDILLSGFDRRRQLGLGTFITYAEIQKRGAPDLADLLRDIPGVIVHRSGALVAVHMGRTPATSRCGPVVYMDGLRVTHSTDPPRMAGDIIASTTGESLEAVEVYRGRTDTPAEFADPDTRCGAIVIWTKRPSLHLPPPKKRPDRY